MYRHPDYGGWGPSSDFTHQYEKETTRPKPLRVFDMSDATFSMEEIHNSFLEAKKGHEEHLEVRFLWEVSGIGDVTVEKLLKKFRNADKVFSATAEEIAKVPGISEGRARQIRKKLDDHDKEYGQEYRDKKRKEPFTYHDSQNPSYTYRAESFESTADSKS
jgi:NAD-dependent DNA ligase